MVCSWYSETSWIMCCRELVYHGKAGESLYMAAFQQFLFFAPLWGKFILQVTHFLSSSCRILRPEPNCRFLCFRTHAQLPGLPLVLLSPVNEPLVLWYQFFFSKMAILLKKKKETSDMKPPSTINLNMNSLQVMQHKNYHLYGILCAPYYPRYIVTQISIKLEIKPALHLI